MASIVRSIDIAVPASFAWAAVANIGGLHTDLVQGFVTDTRLDGLVRHVTFANGMTAAEHVISVDPELLRLAYTAVGGRASHHNAAVQVLAVDDSSCRVIWATDVLPDDLSAPIGHMVDAGAAAMTRTLEERYRAQAV